VDLPKVPDESFAERAGIIHVERVTNDAKCIWRETPLRDVGIDGQIEYVNPQREAMGRIVLVQVKSGPSYFAKANEVAVPYYANERHRNYWGHAPLPVILVLHNPEDYETIWVDARREIQMGRAVPITVRRDAPFDARGVLQALSWDGAPLPIEPQSADLLFEQLLAERHEEASFPLSFFDLFVNGLTDIGRGLYFGMDLVTEIVSAKLQVSGFEFGMGIGGPEYEFLDRYVAYLVANNLVRFDFDWYRQSLQELQMVATLMGPLTPRGRALVEYIASVDRGRQVERGPYDQVVVERFVSMVWIHDVLPRTAWIEEFKTWLRDENARQGE
jgi:hypothetical protein